MKKLISVLLAVMLVMSLYAAAMAADPENPINPNNGNVAGAGRTVSWTDTFKATATDPQNLPAATFNYAIAAATADVPATPSSPLVKKGVGAPTISNAVHAATTPGTDALTNSVTVTADFTNVSFTEAGIYRYNVTETKGTSNSAADIVIDTGNSNLGTYILDVYVKKVAGTNGAADTFEPYAYALSKTGEFASFTHDTTNHVWNAVYKGNDDAGKVNEIVNELTTYDLTITKVITGDAAANEFEFTIDIIGVPSDVYVKQDDKTAVAGGGTFTAKLTNGKSTVIKGLPSIAGYNIKEAVNQLEGYEVTVTVNGTESTDKTYHWIGTEGQGVAYGSEVKDTGIVLGAQNTTIVFTNNLDNISPTGVVLRVAPYALILIAGVALVLISRRRRTEKE